MGTTLWTARRRKLVERFVVLAQRRLRLADWEIILDFDDEAGADSVATCTRAEHQKRATIRFNSLLFLECSATDQRQTLLHELLHCHLFDVHEAATLAVDAVEGAAHRATLNAVVRARVEQATDALADALVAMFDDVPVPATQWPLTVREIPASPVPQQDAEAEHPPADLTVVAADPGTDPPAVGAGAAPAAAKAP